MQIVGFVNERSKKLYFLLKTACTPLKDPYNAPHVVRETSNTQNTVLTESFVLKCFKKFVKTN